MAIHTFSIELPALKKKEYWIAWRRIISLCQYREAQNETTGEPECKVHYRTKNYRYIQVHFRDYPGILLALHEYNFPRLELTINPSVLNAQDYDSLYTYDDLTFRYYEKCVNRIMRMLCLPYRFLDMRLKRCDCTLDIDLDTDCTVRDLLSCIRKTQLGCGYREESFDERTNNWREKNEHSFRAVCKDIQLTAYDKSFQLMEEKLMPEDQIPPNRLRLEVAFTSHAIHRVLDKFATGEVHDTCEGKIKRFSDLSEELLSTYMEQVLTPGEYTDLETAVQRVAESGYQQETRKLMIDFLIQVRKHWTSGIPGAIRVLQKAHGLSQRQIDLLLERFKALDLNPATLPDTCTQKKIPSLTSLMREKPAVSD